VLTFNYAALSLAPTKTAVSSNLLLLCSLHNSLLSRSCIVSVLELQARAGYLSIFVSYGVWTFLRNSFDTISKLVNLITISESQLSNLLKKAS